MIDMLASLFGLKIPGLGTPSPLGTDAAGGSQDPGAAQMKASQGAMQSASAALSGADHAPSIMSAQQQRPVDINQLMTILQNRQRLGSL